MQAGTGVAPADHIVSKKARDRKELDQRPGAYYSPRGREQFVGGTSEGTVWKTYPVAIVVIAPDNKNLKSSIPQDTDWRQKLMRSLVDLPFNEVTPPAGETRDLFRAEIDPEDLYDESALDKNYSVMAFTVLYWVEENRT